MSRSAVNLLLHRQPTLPGWPPEPCLATAPQSRSERPPVAFSASPGHRVSRTRVRGFAPWEPAGAIASAPQPRGCVAPTVVVVWPRWLHTRAALLGGDRRGPAGAARRRDHPHWLISRWQRAFVAWWSREVGVRHRPGRRKRAQISALFNFHGHGRGEDGDQAPAGVVLAQWSGSNSPLEMLWARSVCPSGGIRMSLITVGSGAWNARGGQLGDRPPQIRGTKLLEVAMPPAQITLPKITGAALVPFCNGHAAVLRPHLEIETPLP